MQYLVSDKVRENWAVIHSTLMLNLRRNARS